MKTLICLVTTLVLLLSCNPSQHDEARYGTVRYAFGPSLDTAGPFRPDQLLELRDEMRVLNALGPTFVETTEAQADVVIRPMNSSLRSGSCHNAVECYLPGATYFEIDPAQAHGYLELRAACGHGTGHFLGMGHVCFYGGELPDCEVGVGAAMMNQNIAYGDPVTAMPGDPTGVAQDTPTILDLREFRRVHP